MGDRGGLYYANQHDFGISKVSQLWLCLCVEVHGKWKDFQFFETFEVLSPK
jgi:hypothetical protein